MAELNINTDYLLQVAGDDKELVRMILDEYESDAIDLIADLNDALRPEIKLGELRRILHKLRGSSSSLGMVSLCDEIIKLESMSEDQWANEGFDSPVFIEHLSQSVKGCKKVLT